MVGWTITLMVAYLMVGCLSAFWVYHPFPTKDVTRYPVADFFAVVLFWPLLLLVTGIGKLAERFSST